MRMAARSATEKSVIIYQVSVLLIYHAVGSFETWGDLEPPVRRRNNAQ
jgi:hypothetical protein